MEVRRLLKRDAEQFVELVDEDDDGDPGREPDRDGARHEADESSDAEYAHEEQQDPSEERSHEQSFIAMREHDARDDWDEGAGRSGDLERRAPEQADEDPSDDGRVQAVHRSDT